MRRGGRWTEDAITRSRSKGADKRKVVRYMYDATRELYAVCFVPFLKGSNVIANGGERYVVAGAGVWFCESVHC